MPAYTTLGPGDAATWPACYGHPNDPRTGDIDGLGDDAVEAARDEAEAEFLSDGGCIVDALAEHSRAGTLVSAATLAADDYHAIGRPLEELMAVMAMGTPQGADAALHEWRDRVRELMREHVLDRADDLLRERGLDRNGWPA